MAEGHDECPKHVNFASISNNAHEFLLTIACVYPKTNIVIGNIAPTQDVMKARVEGRFYMSPAVAKGMMEMLSIKLDTYEKENGPINKGQSIPGDITIQ